MRIPLIGLFILIAGCSSNTQPPATPPSFVAPPEVATKGFVTTVVTAEIPMSVTELRAFLLENPFITFLEATETISPPENTEILQGEWLTPGAVRRIQLADGHYVIERILENRPELFKYQVWVFTNEAARGVEQIVGEQRFIAIDEDNVLFEWTYNIKPKSALTRPFVKRRQPEFEKFMTLGTNAMAKAATQAAQQ